MIENKLRGLNKIAFLIPPGANQVALLTGNAVGNWKR
jgi:hypothetical protein